ncbi:hypothetical protein Athai_35420 [Actinocatenispora thailandica]|uniref:Uncharacterized protein n=1 Tax=Actinocatenispora thailandica TaxID=227318 RepID=A0A7R7DQI3_9ACTN|nr:hypothetical protein Athai_35420 [Actinocatenispora thailandica]
MNATDSLPANCCEVLCPSIRTSTCDGVLCFAARAPVAFDGPTVTGTVVADFFAAVDTVSRVRAAFGHETAGAPWTSCFAESPDTRPREAGTSCTGNDGASFGFGA